MLCKCNARKPLFFCALIKTPKEQPVQQRLALLRFGATCSSWRGGYSHTVDQNSWIGFR